MHINNKELAEIFHNMAAIYRYHGDDRFRALAYDKASRAIASLPEDIGVYVKQGKLEDIPGYRGAYVGENKRIPGHW